MDLRSMARVAVLIAPFCVVAWSWVDAQTNDVPAGFEITEFAGGFPGARTLKIGPDGGLLLPDDGGGRIYRIKWTGAGT